MSAIEAWGSAVSGPWGTSTKCAPKYCTGRPKATERTRSEKCDHHRKHGRGCPAGRTCRDQRRGGARRPVVQRRTVSISVQPRGKPHRIHSSSHSFYGPLGALSRDMVGLLKTKPPTAPPQWGPFLEISLHASDGRTLVRRIAGSTSWRGRPLTLMRPWPALHWATAYVHSNRQQNVVLFGGSRVVGSSRLMRLGGPGWWEDTDSRVTLLAEALNHLRSSHVCGFVWLEGVVGRVERAMGCCRRFGASAWGGEVDRLKSTNFRMWAAL